MLRIDVKSPRDGRVVAVRVLRIDDECWFDAEDVLSLFGYDAEDDAEVALTRIGGPGYVLTKKKDSRSFEHARFVNIRQVGMLMKGSGVEIDARGVLRDLCESVAGRMEEA